MYIWTDFDEQGRVCAVNKNSVGYTPGSARWAIGEYDGTHYVESGRVVERPSMPLSISGTTITGIPAGSVLTLGEQEYQVDDGEAEIDGYSGTVKITCWPYLDAEVVV